MTEPPTPDRTPAPTRGPEVVLCGEAMLLMVAEPGVPLQHAVSFRRSVAGAETNVATGLARLGHAVRWLGRLGDDPAGRAVLAQVRAEGVDTSHVVLDAEAPTGLLLRDSHPARAIDVQYHRAGSAASRLAPEEVSAEALRGARLLHLTGITPMLSETSRRATERLLDLARESGVRVSLDPNVRHKLGSPQRWREVVGPLLDRADLVLAGTDELDLLAGERAGADTHAARLLAAGVDTVVVKHPDKSATCHTATSRTAQPAFTVPLTDPVGAGDAFAAGFLSGRLRGADDQSCLAQGAAVAALVVGCVTDTDGLPDRTALERALAGLTADGGAETVHR
ncbi:sugar kinase [Streptomyces sp. NPDC059740]|uniref:sugar kinase n=1 Tax=Streptomyces sp. NPDC059740 TaxID=3346926 RepID=UPI00364A27C2